MILGTGERLRAYVSSRFPSYFDLPVVLFGYLAIALKIVVRRLPCSRKFRSAISAVPNTFNTLSDSLLLPLQLCHSTIFMEVVTARSALRTLVSERAFFV